MTLHILLRPDDDTILTIKVRELDDLILQPRSVSAQTPGEVTDTQDLSAELELETIVADLTNITVDAGDTRRGSKLIFEKQILRLLVEDFDRTIDSVKEAEFKSYVRGNLSFPRQVGIPDMCYTQSRFIEVIAGAVGSLIGIVAREPVIPRLPIGATELEAVDPRDVLHELLGVDIPPSTDSPEVPPTAVLVEAAGAISAVGQREVVAVAVVVVEATEVTFLAIDIGAGVDRAYFGIVGELIDDDELQELLRSRHTEVLEIIALMGDEPFELMILTHLLIIVGELCEGQCRTTTYIHIEHTLRIIPRLVVVADLRAGITLVVSYLKRELKPINRLNIEVCTAHQGIAQRLIVVEVSQLDRIVVLTIGAGDAVVIDPIPAVIEDVCSRQRVMDMDRIDRSDSLGEVCTIGRSTTERARTFGACVRQPNIRTERQPGADIIREVSTEVVALVA